MILNYIWKVISGWNNYPCKVISHKIDEKKMGNRGSKSKNISNNVKEKNISNFVKEQRADGSWYIKPKLMYLRCALMGFERNYQFNILSKQNKNLSFSTLTKKSKLNPWFITGFSDAESSFSILVQPNSKHKTNWRIKAIFSISLHRKDTEILEIIKNTLGIGKINNKGLTQVVYRVESFNELDILINHFEKYPLVTVKLSDYLIFKQCFEIIKERKHITKDGLLKIISLKTNLNRGLPPNIVEAFPNIVPIPRPDFLFKGIPDPFWISGFVSGDGYFTIKIGNNAGTSIGIRVESRFGIGLHIREVEIIKGVAAYFNLLYPIVSSSENSNECDITKNDEKSNVKYKYIRISDKVVSINISKLSDIVEKIIPFFEKYPIQGKKALDFEDFKKVVEIMKTNNHLTLEGLEKILEIRKGMNRNRLW